MPKTEPAEITAADRKRFPYHTDDSILGIKLIESLSESQLKQALKSPKRFAELQQRIGTDTNPSWTRGQIANVLYDRGSIDEREYDRLSE